MDRSQPAVFSTAVFIDHEMHHLSVGGGVAVQYTSKHPPRLGIVDREISTTPTGAGLTISVLMLMLWQSEGGNRGNVYPMLSRDSGDSHAAFDDCGEVEAAGWLSAGTRGAAAPIKLCSTCAKEFALFCKDYTPISLPGMNYALEQRRNCASDNHPVGKCLMLSDVEIHCDAYWQMATAAIYFPTCCTPHW